MSQRDCPSGSVTLTPQFRTRADGMRVPLEATRVFEMDGADCDSVERAAGSALAFLLSGGRVRIRVDIETRKRVDECVQWVSRVKGLEVQVEHSD